MNRAPGAPSLHGAHGLLLMRRVRPEGMRTGARPVRLNGIPDVPSATAGWPVTVDCSVVVVVVVVVATLNDYAPSTLDLVHEAMFLRNPPRPATGKLVFERFRVPDPIEWIPQALLDQSCNPSCDLSVILNPMLVIGPSLP